MSRCTTLLLMFLFTCAIAAAQIPADRDVLLSGEGAGQGAAAELNGYPGPKHVLDLAALGPVGQGLEQGRRLGHAQAHGHLGPRSDQGGGLIGGFQPFGVEAGGVVHGVSQSAPLS